MSRFDSPTSLDQLDLEGRIAESEAAFQMLGDFIPQLVWMANPDGWIYWYNKRWYEYTGTTPSEMEGWGWQAVHDPEELPKVMERWQASIQTGEPFEMVFPLRGADGVFRPFLTRIVPARDEQGRVVRWFGTNTDISEQRAAELALGKSLKREQMISEIVGYIRSEIGLEKILLKTCDALGRFTDADRCTVWLYNPETGKFNIPLAEYRRLEEFMPAGETPCPDSPVLPNMDQRRTVALSDINQADGLTDTDRQIIKARGIQSLLHVPILYSDELLGVLRVHAITRPREWSRETIEVVENVAAQAAVAINQAKILQALEVGEKRKSAILTASLDAIITIDSNSRIVEWNQAAESLFGYLREEVLGQPLVEFIIPERYRSAHREGLARFLRTGEGAAIGKRVELPALRRDGTEFPAEIAITPLKIKDTVLFTGTLRDISAQKQAEQDVILANERYRLVVEATQDGLWDWDMVTGDLYWNDRLFELLGLDKTKFAASFETYMGLIPEEDRQILQTAMQNHLEKDLPFDIEHRIRHSSGRMMYFHCKGKAVRDAQGKSLRLTGVASDITERRLAEEALRESEGRFRALGDATSMLIAVSDKDGKPVYFNRMFYDFTGATPEELLVDTSPADPARGDKGFMQYIHPDDKQLLLEKVRAGFPSHQEFRVEYRARRKDGVYRTLLNTSSPRFNPDGEFQGFVSSAMDITDQKESVARLERFFESDLLGIVYWNRSGHITGANDAFLQMLGYTRDELERGELDWRSMTPPEFAHLDEAALAEMEGPSGSSEPYEKQYISKDGRRVDIQLAVAYFPGSREEGLAYIMDISNRKEAEREREASLHRERMGRKILEITSQAMDTESILNAASEELGRFLEADRCSITRYSMEDGKLKIWLSGQYRSNEGICPISEEDLDLILRAVQHLSPQALEEGQQQITVMNNPEAIIENARQRLEELKVTDLSMDDLMRIVEKYSNLSSVRNSIYYRGVPYGAISLNQCTYAREWTQDELDLIKYVADQLGSALYQAELFHQEQQARKEQEWTNRLLRIISEAQSHFITNENIYSLFEAPLNDLLALTESEYGFIGEVLHTPEGRPYLKCNFLTNIAWDEETRRLYDENKATGFEFHKLDNLFGLVITSGQVVISNDPQNDPRSAGRPGGHPPLKAFLGMPFYKGDTMVGMVGIANRPGGYDMELVEELKPFLNACANIIIGSRNETQRQKLTHDLKVSERALKIYASKLERSNQELEQFATIASHDLQAPLRKVIMFSEYLKTSMGDKMPPESLDYMDRIQKATRKMQSLITDLLVLSRVTRKGQPFVPIDLKEVAVDATSDLEEVIRETGGQVAIGEMIRIDADPTQMSQMLQNLIGNALKFHRPDERPQVSVEARAINSQTCQITVRDNGIGFEEKYLDRIFSVFERLHGETEYEGTGMGLAIVKKIAERHGGTVTAKSAPGQGATFMVTLPIHQSQK